MISTIAVKIPSPTLSVLKGCITYLDLGLWIMGWRLHSSLSLSISEGMGYGIKQAMPVATQLVNETPVRSSANTHLAERRSRPKSGNNQQHQDEEHIRYCTPMKQKRTALP